jgi:hypothetical protein
MPPGPLGGVSDAVRWKKQNIERWLHEGYKQGSQKTFPF